jgi:DNA ligase D-like protein (predicted 3'-phosphoesterase)
VYGAMSGKLKEYTRKRNFRKTTEPAGARGKKTAARFVIQKHDASHLHYDFRLAIHGVLVSWAVPKGLSTDPRDKRLAIQTEDHPLDYIDFEGVIPAGQYGAGTVLVWDTGRYRNLRADKTGDGKSMSASLREGLIEVWLEGSKLSGGYALKRIRSGKKPQWLVIKMRDEEADARRNPVSTQPESVLTGRTLKEIAAAAGGDR